MVSSNFSFFFYPTKPLSSDIKTCHHHSDKFRPGFSGVRVTRSLYLYFVLLSFFIGPLCCLSFDLWVLITWYLQTLLVLVGIFKKKKSIHFSPSNQRRDELTIHYAIICVILTKHTCSRLNGYHTTSLIVTAVIRFDTYVLMNFQNHIFLSYN